MSKRGVSRRQLLSSLGLTAGASFLTGCEGALQGAPQEGKAALPEPKKPGSPEVVSSTASEWQYATLEPAAVAAEAYRLMPEGGCMYGLFAAIFSMLAKLQGGPFLSFPVHMMKYGEGGVGLWGSLCGTVNGGAAIIGLFERDKQRRENLIAELLAWYERTELPHYRPKNGSEAIPRTVAHSVLCHVSVGKWCKAAGEEMGSPEMKERCRRLTADVAATTVELLNAHLQTPCKFAGLSREVGDCLSCHGKERRDTLGKMQCGSCHQQLSEKHPKTLRLK